MGPQGPEGPQGPAGPAGGIAVGSLVSASTTITGSADTATATCPTGSIAISAGYLHDNGGNGPHFVEFGRVSDTTWRLYLSGAVGNNRTGTLTVYCVTLSQ
jgi:hypothetical protein